MVVHLDSIAFLDFRKHRMKCRGKREKDSPFDIPSKLKTFLKMRKHILLYSFSTLSYWEKHHNLIFKKNEIMKRLQKIGLSIALITLFASCQTNSNSGQALSSTETRKEIMGKIADDSTMTKEMMAAMMNSNNGMAMMQDHQKMMMGNHETMMKMMKDNPGMMEGMMTNMMEACKNDTAMMSGMCKAMMGNKQMMDMMHKMKGENKDMKMDGMKH